MADTTDPAALRHADAIYTFGGNLFVPDVDAYSRQQSLSTRTIICCRGIVGRSVSASPR